MQGKNEKIVKVLLNGKQVGLVSWNKERNVSIFQYTDDFIKTGMELSPIVMPLGKEPYYSTPEWLKQLLKTYRRCLPIAFPTATEMQCSKTSLKKKTLTLIN